MLRAIAAGEFPESEILAALEDREADTHWIALGALGRVKGDDVRAASLLRTTLDDAKASGSVNTQCICLETLVERLGPGALPDLEAMWERKIHRDIRALIIDAFGDLGVTKHYSGALALFQRGLEQGR